MYMDKRYRWCALNVKSLYLSKTTTPCFGASSWTACPIHIGYKTLRHTRLRAQGAWLFRRCNTHRERESIHNMRERLRHLLFQNVLVINVPFIRLDPKKWPYMYFSCCFFCFICSQCFGFVSLFEQQKVFFWSSNHSCDVSWGFAGMKHKFGVCLPLVSAEHIKWKRQDSTGNCYKKFCNRFALWKTNFIPGK